MSGRSEKRAAYGSGLSLTRYPQMGAVEEPEVPRRERVWNQCRAADSRENAGVYRLL